MLVAFLKLIVLQPQLMLTHAHNYADLMTDRLQHTFTTWRLRVLLYALSAIFFVLGAMGGVVALLLWGALPVLNSQNAWVLVVVPIVLLSMSLFIYGRARRYKIESLFDDIQEQLHLDMLAISQSRHP